MTLPMVDPKELRLRMFFEGATDELIKHGEYLDNPLEFFTGCFEELRDWFGEAKTAKTASIEDRYPDYVTDCCKKFILKNSLMKAAAEGRFDKTAMQGLEMAGAGAPTLGAGAGGGGGDLVKKVEEAQNNIAQGGVAPDRMERRQDIIDSLMPQAEQIGLKPDGEIKIKMPQPDNAGIADPHAAQAENAAEALSQQQPNVAAAEQSAMAANNMAGEMSGTAPGAGDGAGVGALTEQQQQQMADVGQAREKAEMAGSDAAMGEEEPMPPGMEPEPGMDPAMDPEGGAPAPGGEQAALEELMASMGGGGGGGEQMPGMGMGDEAGASPMEGGEIDPEILLNALMGGGQEGKMAQAKLYQLAVAG